MTSNPLDYWHELESRSSEWAFRAYNKLIQTLNNDVQEKLRCKDDISEPYVAIFGKTQVGKTTLLLDLMGIDPDQLITVSQVLRGGREMGKSATATAMEYCRSADHRWGLSIEEKTDWFDCNEKISHQLGKLRSKMEKGELVLTSPCIVHIPQHFFARTDVASPHVRILDLPGDNPANSQEQEHVYLMAKTYLPFADLILLVGRGDDLGFLRPEVITLPGIEDWQTMPYRFRIVTTYSYTAQSIKDRVRANDKFGIEQLRQRLIQQIELFGELSEPAKSEDLYFPLEFGTSWKNVQEHDPSLYNRIAPIIEELRKKLLEQIAQSTSPMGRLRSTLNTHIGVENILKNKKSLIKLTITQLDQKCEKLMNNLNSWEETIKHEKKWKQSINRLLSENQKDDLVRKVLDAANETDLSISNSYPSSEMNEREDVATLKRLIVYHQHALQNITINPKFESIKYLKIARTYFKEPDKEIIKKILDDSFEPIRKILNDYWIDTYLISLNYQKDKKLLLKSILEAKRKIIELWTNSWLNAIYAAYKNLEKKQKTANDNLEYSIKERDKIAKQIEIIELSISQHHLDLENFTLRSQEDLKRCKKFINLLNEEYLLELSEKMEQAILNEDNCESILQFFSCEYMRSQYESLIAMNQK